jgi:PE family
MQSMTFDPSAADIGPQVVDNAAQGLQAGAAAATSFTELVPAGADDVSLRAVTTFAEEAAQLLALNQAAQQELMRVGEAFTRIARMYEETDVLAARRVGATPLGSSELAKVSGL